MKFLENFSLFQQGAEAKLYTGIFLGRPAIVKLRFSKKYRHPILDQQLTKERLKAEVRSLMRCKTIGVKTPTIFLADLQEAVIVMEYLEDSFRCRDYLNKLLKADDQTGISNLAREMGIILGKIHKNNIVHGDLTTSNILVRVKEEEKIELYLIDFGLGYAEASAEDKGVDLYVLERALISTHPNTEYLFDLILKSYKKELNNKKACAEVIKKYEEIRLRGRKRTMEG